MKVKYYNFDLKPKKPNKVFMWFVKRFAADPFLRAHKFTCEHINMEGIKPPYFMLATHGSYMDFRILFGTIKPYNMNFVVAHDAMHDYTITLLRLAGGIAKRRYTRDYKMIRHLRYCVKNHKNPTCVYPEAGFTIDGSSGYLPDSLGKMCKLLDVPVVIIKWYGSFICQPSWSLRQKKRKFIKGVPVKGELIGVATLDEVRKLSVEELNERIRHHFAYDDYKYQLENKIEITVPDRAEGLENILYQCTDCGAEFQTYTHGSTLECRACGKKWEMNKYGQLEAHDGNTKIPHIPDWFAWQRENVRREIESGRYRIEADVEVYSLPKNKFYEQGRGKFTHDASGMRLQCTAYGKPFDKFLATGERESMHFEFKFKNRKNGKYYGDCMDFVTENDSFYLHPVNKRNIVAKVRIATEELFWLSRKNIHKKK